MPQKIQLEIAIGPDGNVRIVTHGLQGEDCLAETASLEKQLGEVAEREKTSEYYVKGGSARARTAQRR
jgi:hypothetical protein